MSRPLPDRCGHCGTDLTWKDGGCHPTTLVEKLAAHPAVPVIWGWGNRRYDLREIAMWLVEHDLTGDRVHDIWSGQLMPGSGTPYLLSGDLQIAALTLVAHVAADRRYEPHGRISMDLKAAS